MQKNYAQTQPNHSPKREIAGIFLGACSFSVGWLTCAQLTTLEKSLVTRAKNDKVIFVSLLHAFFTTLNKERS